jgi:Rad3-related DNA helicase
MSILDHIPSGYEPRPWQVEALQEVERYWDGSDVIVIPGKVGFGKSLVAATISSWRAAAGESTGIITPRVALQEQYSSSFDKIPILKGKHRYQCKESEFKSCGERQEITGNYCTTENRKCACVYRAARRQVESSKEAIFNLSSYYYSKVPRQVTIFDEAHLIYDFITDQFTLKMWKHKDKYPDDLKTAGDLAIWLEGQIGKLSATLRKKGYVENNPEMARSLSKRLTKYSRVRRGLSEAPANFFIERTSDTFRGSTKDVLLVRPASIIGLPEIMWPEKVTQKVVLMSGTISTVDLRRLGLRGKRVRWIKCANPISPERRPVDASWGVNMSYKYQNENVGKLCEKILQTAQKHPENGIIHTTYSLAEKMKKYLVGDRFIWHTQDDKEDKLEEFQNSEGKILVASGMSEGIDLAGDKYTWQVITKIMYPNMGDQLIAKWYKEDYEWILWMTTRTILQQTGRIVRSPEDYGITYIFDSAFGNQAKKRRGLCIQADKYIPGDYKESIKWR